MSNNIITLNSELIHTELKDYPHQTTNILALLIQSSVYIIPSHFKFACPKVNPISSIAIFLL